MLFSKSPQSPEKIAKEQVTLLNRFFRESAKYLDKNIFKKLEEEAQEAESRVDKTEENVNYFERKLLPKLDKRKLFFLNLDKIIKKISENNISLKEKEDGFFFFETKLLLDTFETLFNKNSQIYLGNKKYCYILGQNLENYNTLFNSYKEFLNKKLN